MRSAYFETKFERPVYLNEFAAAIVPSDLSEDVKEGLEKSGIAIYEYDPKIEGDRTRATNAAFEADNRIRFQLVGEKGAANMDKAEEATPRLDNLSVAREMAKAFEEKKKRIEKLRKSDPVVVDGNEYLGKYELNSKSAGDYILNSLRRGYKNADTNELIHISRKSQKVAHHDAENEVHLKSIAYIPQLIEHAIFIDEIPNSKSKNGFESYRYYVVGLNIGGVDYTVRLTVGVKNGQSYYDHALTKIEKGNLLNLTNGVKADVSEKETAISGVKDKRLLSLLQMNEQENARRIKMATGWERGADGKWRYEVMDGEFDRNGELHPERRMLSAEEKKELDDAFFEIMEVFEKGSLAYKQEIDENTNMADIYMAGGMERKKAERLAHLEDKETELGLLPKFLDDYISNDELLKFPTPHFSYLSDTSIQQIV